MPRTILAEGLPISTHKTQIKTKSSISKKKTSKRKEETDPKSEEDTIQLLNPLIKTLRSST
jgi:hypothetical protein